MEDLIFWSRAQFALTAMYHWLFVPLTLGLGVIIGIMETFYYRTNDEKWKTITQFWMRLFGVNFAIGVATGLILEFQFGTNWSNYSWFVGDIFGAPLAIEGILAFFMEATFIAIMFFGWNKVSKGFHLASTWLTVLGASISALWILVANAWMQYPTGITFNPDTFRNEMTDFWAVALSPMAINKFFHTVISCWVVGAAACLGVSAWFLLKGKDVELAKRSIRIAAPFGVVAILLTSFTGDGSAYQVSQKQPMKLAAMEGLYDGQTSAPFTLVGPLKVPGVLSYLAYRDIDAFVPGINDILAGYTLTDGTVVPSADERMEQGAIAKQALNDYRAAKKEGNDSVAAANLEVLHSKYEHFGYAFIKDKAELVPNVPITFWAFRIMVFVGSIFILLFLVMSYLAFKKPDYERYRWLLIVCIIGIPMAYLVSQCGWIVAEVGRQPWVIQDLMPRSAAVSAVSSNSVLTTFIIFCVLFTVLLIAEMSIMFKQIKKGF